MEVLRALKPILAKLANDGTPCNSLLAKRGPLLDLVLKLEPKLTEVLHWYVDSVEAISRHQTIEVDELVRSWCHSFRDVQSHLLHVLLLFFCFFGSI
jgi:hypothetical protein